VGVTKSDAATKTIKTQTLELFMGKDLKPQESKVMGFSNRGLL